MPKSANAQLNVEIGKRIKDCRKAAGFSQTELGKRINVSFQQIQKYESATTRIPAERLIGMAVALGVPVQLLIPTQAGSNPAEQPQTGVIDEGLEADLLMAFRLIETVELKRTVIALAKCLARK